MLTPNDRARTPLVALMQNPVLHDPAADAGASTDQGDVAVLDSLRAVAALSVVWFHFTQGSAVLSAGSWLKASGTQGWAGAEMFFAISGFVMPWALARYDYALSHFPRFMLRRLARLEPPYLCSLAIMLGLNFISGFVPGFRGPPFHLDLGSVGLHLLFLNEWFAKPWANPVYWTLAIELQFYVLLGLGYPLLSSTKWPLRATALIALALGTLHHSVASVLSYGAFFSAGFATFLFMRKRIGARELCLYLLTASACCTARGGVVLLVAVLAPTLGIVFLRRRVPGLDLIGRFSYSLYLLHVPIGGRILNLAARVTEHSPWLQAAALGVALAVSLVASHVFYRAVEQPALRLARSIRY